MFVSSSTPNGQLSDQYLQDRANFLVQLLHENIHDTGAKNPYAPMNMDVYPNLPAYYYADLATGKQSLNAVYSDLATKKDNYQQFIFGSKEGDPDITGGSRDDHLYGMGGNDTINGYGGNDYIEGGQGQDTMYGGAGNDTFCIQGEDDAYDVFYGGGDEDTIQGSKYDDTIRVHNFDYATNSIEKIVGGAGTNIIAGTDGDDTIDLTGVTVTNIAYIDGGAGVDTITGTGQDDHIYGGAGGDTLKGMGGDDELYGTVWDETSGTMVDDHAIDHLEGGAGHDIYHIGAGDIVSDSDHQGTIWFNGAELPTLLLNQVQKGGNYYESEDKSYRAVLDDKTGTLTVNVGGGPASFTIENFTSGSMGVSLKSYIPPPDQFDITLNGTAYRDEMGIDTFEGRQITDWYLECTAFPAGVSQNSPFFSRQLPEFAPSLHVTGGSSGDYLFGFSGHDDIAGGAGNDIITGNIVTCNGKPLYSEAFVAGDILDGGAGNDWITGRGGDDLITGGDGNDIIQSYDGQDFARPAPPDGWRISI